MSNTFNKIKKIINCFFLIFFFINSGSLFGKDTPIIVISPSKNPQSISTVGSSVIVMDEKFLEESNEYFLGDVLSKSSTSINFFQTGGYGATSGIQLRGLPKRYSTVYIDGIRVSDPSSVSNDYDFNHILTSQISRVEILKGNQSSLYGSGAIGGTINITTKKPKPGKNNTFHYSTGSHKTHNLSFSHSISDEKNNLHFGGERFQTDGISQMTHNNEKDAYKNNLLFTNFKKSLPNNFQLNGIINLSKTYLQYDKEINTLTTTHSEEEKTLQSLSGITLSHDTNKKLTNNLTYNKTFTRRTYNPAPGSGNLIKDSYNGDRNFFSYNGEYKISLDNNIVFGLEREYDLMRYNKDLTGISKKNYYTTSEYFDLQSRLSENLFTTYGFRLSENSVAGNEEAHRITLAYLLNNKNTKLRSSYGSGFRFPSLYEMYYVYASNSSSLPYVKAEKSKSFDIGIDKTLSNLSFSATYFNISYTDSLEGWESNTSSGSSYTYQNTPSKVKSQGLELSSNWKKNNFLNFNFNYTYTSTYDGAEADDPNRNQNYTNNQIVRVPRHLINLHTNFSFPRLQNIDFTINSKWSDAARDYGNGNRTYSDERTDDYLVSDLQIKYEYSKNYNFFLNVINLFNEKYETARDYSQMNRSINLGLKKVY